MRFYDPVSANDADSFDHVVATIPGTLVLGTAPGEFVRNWDRLQAGSRTEGYGFEPGDALAGSRRAPWGGSSTNRSC
jgi:hypothetical protein